MKLAVRVVGLFAAVVDPHGRHADRLGRREVARHVVDEQRGGGVDAEGVAQPGDRRDGSGLGDQVHRMDVVDRLEAVAPSPSRSSTLSA